MPGRSSTRAAASVHLARILDALQAHYGELTPHWPIDPYLFLVWWHCGYPPSEERCERGWRELQDTIGAAPEKLLAAAPSRLAQTLQRGGMAPELRATRIRSIAKAVHEEYAGDLRAGLAALPLQKASAALRRFPGVGTPGAERILLFTGIAPLAAVPSACPYVLPRIAGGREPQDYRATYAQAQRLLEAQLPATFAARTRAYLLLQSHGRQLCKRTNPGCKLCPVADSCAYAARRRRRTARAHRGVS